MRILLVAASPSDAHLAQRTLQRGLGDAVHVVHVDRLSQALQKLQTAAFDATVLDMGLPDADGLEALARVRASHPEMPVLALIDWGDDELGVRAIQAGAQDSVIKSLGDIQRLCRSVRYALERSKLVSQSTPDEPERIAVPANREHITLPPPERNAHTLAEASRLAGKAELATRVLEDVGNLLGAAMSHTANIERRTEPAAIRQMQNLADLVEENLDDLTFFGPGGRGRTVPAYMRAIADRLAKEARSAHSDVERLGEVLDEMAGAISTQHRSPAEVTPPASLCDVDRLVLEVLGMHKGRFDAHDIRVSTDLGITEHCQVEPDHMVQILAALIANGVDALVESDASPRRLLIRSRLNSGRARIDVGDNGVGIVPAVGSQMFGFGFSTKPGRDGFGLHSCATAIRGLGGQLTWRSKGAAQGAVFTIDVPQLPLDLTATVSPDALATVTPDSQDTVLGPIVVDTR